MKKAVLYARVSTDIQQKEGTIDSQIIELKKQIVGNGDVLVREYADAGHSGAKMDRPALDQLRKDLKTDLFDTIYFLNTDRIARDVTYQNILITEILKHKKQIIINGKDYVHNPENKFELTVLGAVAELERAKMIERSLRGKLHKLRQGHLLGYGYNIYGYNYIPRSNSSPAQLEINEKEGKVIRYIFDSYASEKVSWSEIVRGIEGMGATTKTGNRHWPQHRISQILRNSTYSGIRYFNTCRHVKTESNPLRKIKYGKKVFRDRSEWIPVKVPAIISKTVFDKVQERIVRSAKLYKSPKQIQLLSNLVCCGECGRFFMAYRRYMRHYYKYKGARKRTANIYYRAAYKCNRRAMDRVHLKGIGLKQCTNPEVSARRLDPFVWNMIEEHMVKPAILKRHLIDWGKEVRATQSLLEKELEKINQAEQQLKEEREEILDLYANSNLEREAYTEKCLYNDIEVDRLKLAREDVTKKIPVLYKKEVVDANLRLFCESVRARMQKCDDFNSKRRFLLDFVEGVVYDHEKVTLKGRVPLQLQAQSSDQINDLSKINFVIEKQISNASSKSKPTTD